MGFFKDLGKLMKKYNFEIHTVQLDENVKILNDRFHLALKKEDLPPPVILLRTSEGDFVPQIFGPVTINNEEKNIKFFNVKDSSTFYLFPEEKKEEPKVEEVKKEEVKAEPEKPAVEEELSPTEAQQVVTTLNALGNALQNGMDWEETPAESVEEKKEEKPAKKKRASKKIVKTVEKDPTEKNYLVIGDNNYTTYDHFVEPNLNKLLHFKNLIDVIRTVCDNKIEPKLTSKEGKDIIKNIGEMLKETDAAIILSNSARSNIAKKVIKMAESKGIEIIQENDF